MVPRTSSHQPRTTAKARATSSSYNIPFLRNRRFVGRVKKLVELEEKLMISNDCQKLALVGLGGVGKTQVALELAYTVKERWPEYSIFWVPALSAESFEQAYRDIAIRCSIPLNPKEEDPKESVQRYLSSGPAGKWFLVVDNSDDQETLFGTSGGLRGVTDYLPQSENGLTLFTTRHREVAVFLVGSEVVEIQEMDSEEAETFLTKSLTRKELLRNRTATTELLHELTNLPLAIAQATAYLNARQISIRDYLFLLRKTEQDMVSLLSREFRDETRYRNSKNSVATTWLVSFDQIRRSDPIAADLLSFMSCIESKGIPRSILPSVKPEEHMVHAIGTLSAYAFVTRRDESDTYDMHRLVHLATRVWLTEHGTTEAMHEKVAARLAEIFPSDDYSNRAMWREYFPHALRFLQNSTALDSSNRSDLCMAVGRCLRVDGRVGEAVMWLSECFLWRQKYLAKDHPSRLASRHVLAMAYQANGQVKKAVELLKQVVAIREKVLAEDHPDRLASQHVLAMAYQANGQVTKAVELLEQVVVIEEKVLAEDHPDRLASRHELARAYRANGQVKKAVELLERVVAIQEKVLAEDHPSRLASQHELARAYQANGQVTKAVELLEQVVAIQEKVLAEDHPDRLASQHVLAMAYQANGQVTKAVELLEQVVVIEEKVLAEDHPDRLASRHELARAYQANGQVTKAVELLEQVVAIQEKVLAEDHPSRLASQHELARAYQANGQVKKAVELLERVVAIQEKVLAEDHPSRLASQHELAGAYQANGQVTKAVELLKQVVAIREKVLAEDHPDRLASRHVLARAYQANGQVTKAVELLEQVVAIREKVLAEDHPHRLISQHALTMLYAQQRFEGEDK